MTCIVGIEDDGVVWMAGDTLATADDVSRQRRDTKVFRRDDYVIGFAASYRLGQLVRYTGTLPVPPKRTGDLEGFMASAFVDALRDIEAAGGYVRQPETAGRLLVGVRGRLFSIEGDLQAGRTSYGYDAIGLGSEAAMGALFASRWMGGSMVYRCKLALRAAAAFTPSVGAPFTVLAGGFR